MEKREPPSMADLAHKLTLTVSEAALLTGFGRHAIEEACNTGALVSRRPGQREIRINRADLDEWLRNLPKLPVERPSRVVPIRPVRR